MISNPWPLEAERAFWRSKCKESFWWFLQMGWGAYFYMRDHPNDRWVTPEIHRPLCDWLQERAEEWRDRRAKGIKVRTKVAVVIPRGFGKTVSVTKAFSLWNHLWDPDLATYIGSEVQTKAEGFLEPIKEIMSSPRSSFVWLYGNWARDKSRTWTGSEVVHSFRQSQERSEPSYFTWGVEKGLTGHHPDMGFFDDPLSEEKIKESGQWLNTVRNSVAALRPAFRSDSFFALVCTRYRDDDVVGTYLTREGVRSWAGMPCPYTDPRYKPRADGEWDVYFLQARDAQGASILPAVHPTEELDRYQASLPAEFSAQMMNDPGTGEHAPITVEQIEDMYVRKDEIPLQLRVTIHSDVAFKEVDFSQHGSETVIVVVGHDPRGNGDVFFLEGYGSYTWRSEDYLKKLTELVRKYEGSRRSSVAWMTAEKEAGATVGLWETAVKSWMRGSGSDRPARIPDIKTFSRGSRNKDKRIMETFPYWVDGHVKLVRNAPGVQSLVHNVLRFHVIKDKDWLDAFTDCFHPDIYNMMQLPSGKDEGSVPLSPGDDLLKGFRRPKTADDVRYIYDQTWGPYMEESEDSWSQ